MKKSFIASQEWRDLFDAALAFRNIQCWKWMKDSDLFGVQNPADGEVHHCCVLGALGQVLGLTVYLGPEGLDAYFKIQTHQVPWEDISLLYIQKCLLASFEDRKSMQEPDLEVIKNLGLRFRGPQSWPLFRSYRPGYLPWFLNEEEVNFLTIALKQAREVALRLKEDREMLTPPEEGHYLIRVADQSDEGLKWRDEWLKPLSFVKKPIVLPAVDQIRLHRIQKTLPQSDGVWETDFFHAPMPVHEGERPYFPYMFLMVDHSSGLILKNHLADLEEYPLIFQNQFLDFIEENNALPKHLMVGREEAYRLLEPISSKLGINLVRVKKLQEVEKARKHLEDFWRSWK